MASHPLRRYRSKVPSDLSTSSSDKSLALSASSSVDSNSNISTEARQLQIKVRISKEVSNWLRSDEQATYRALSTGQIHQLVCVDSEDKGSFLYARPDSSTDSDPVTCEVIHLTAVLLLASCCTAVRRIPLPPYETITAHKSSWNSPMRMSSLQQHDQRQFYPAAGHHARETSAASELQDSFDMSTDSTAEPQMTSYASIVKRKDQMEKIESMQEFLDWSCNNPRATDRISPTERYIPLPPSSFTSGSESRPTYLLPRTITTPEDLGRHLSRANSAPLPSPHFNARSGAVVATGKFPSLLGPLTKFKRRFPATIGPVIRARTMPMIMKPINAIRSRRPSSTFSRRTKRARKERRKSQTSISPEESTSASASVSPSTPSPSTEFSLTNILAATDFTYATRPSLLRNAKTDHELDSLGQYRETRRRMSHALGLLDYLDETRRASIAPRNLSSSTRGPSARSSISSSAIRAFPPALRNLEPPPHFHIPFKDDYFPAAPLPIPNETAHDTDPDFITVPLDIVSNPRSDTSKITIIHAPLSTKSLPANDPLSTTLPAKDSDTTPLAPKPVQPTEEYFAPAHRAIHLAPYPTFTYVSFVPIPEIAITRPPLSRPRSRSDTHEGLAARRMMRSLRIEEGRGGEERQGRGNRGLTAMTRVRTERRGGEGGEREGVGEEVGGLREEKMNRRRAVSN